MNLNKTKRAIPFFLFFLLAENLYAAGSDAAKEISFFLLGTGLLGGLGMFLYGMEMMSD
ncbi:uncharacterized protein METZ01_LOCUS117231, partial [marine metagenome]